MLPVRVCARSVYSYKTAEALNSSEMSHAISLRPLEVKVGDRVVTLPNIAQYIEKRSKDLRRLQKKIASLRAEIIENEKRMMDIIIARLYRDYACRPWPRKFHYMVDELANGGTPKPVKQRWTFMMIDVIDYTNKCQHASDLRVDQFRTEMNSVFGPIIQAHGVERLPEVGDAVLLASSSALEMVRTALDIINAAKTFGKGPDRKPLTDWLRFGMHTGSVVFGSPDKQNPTASGLALCIVARLENRGKAFRIHASSATKKRLTEELLQIFSTIKNKIEFITRRPLKMKGLKRRHTGPTYWVNVLSDSL